MNTPFRFALTLLSTALLLPNVTSCQASTPRTMSYQVNYQSPDQPQVLPDVDASVFYKELKPYGKWVKHRTYGRVWYPLGVPKNWRPYTNGHWARTNEYGWLWIANEPWGWAPYHYGRWAWDDWYGWIWVPGHTWAPAWVFWREGGGYTAWAPMPPSVVWNPSVGINVQHFNYSRDIHRDSWVGVRNNYLASPDISTRYYPTSSNTTIINKTKIIQQSNIIQYHNSIHNNVSVANHTIVNTGPSTTIINAPIVPVIIATTIPVNVTATTADTATAVIIQPQIPAPTPEQVAQEEQLAKALIAQNIAAAKVPADKQPREAGRLTGIPAPDGIATPINANEPTPVVNDLVPNPPLPQAQSPVTVPTSQAPQVQVVDSAIPATPTSPVTTLVPVPQNPAQPSVTPPANQAPQVQVVDPAIPATPTPPVTTLVPVPQNPAQPLVASPNDPALQKQQAEQAAAQQATQQAQQQATQQAAQQAQQQAEQAAAQQAAQQAQQQATQQAAQQAQQAQQQAEQAAAQQAAQQAQQQAEQAAAQQAAQQAQQQATQQAAQAQQAADAAAKKKADCLAAGRTDCDNP